METFEFKKAIYELDEMVMEEFKRRFKSIEKDEFLTNSNYGARVTASSLTGYKQYDKDSQHWSRIDEYESSMDKFMGDEYDAKLGMYNEFMQWVTQNNKNNTILGRVYCPYTKEVIKKVYFPSVYTMSKLSYNLGDFVRERSTYKVKVKDLFKINLKNDPTNHMSQKAIDLFFSYWSYNVLDKVTLKDAKDKDLVKVTSQMGTLYYGNGGEVWSNQMYFAPKGFYVKMRKGRVFIPCPMYPSLKEDLKVLSEDGVVKTDHEKLPTEDERLVNAIEFGVLDSALMPKKKLDKVKVIHQIEQIIDSKGYSGNEIEAYDLIKELMLGN